MSSIPILCQYPFNRPIAFCLFDLQLIQQNIYINRTYMVTGRV